MTPVCAPDGGPTAVGVRLSEDVAAHLKVVRPVARLEVENYLSAATARETGRVQARKAMRFPENRWWGSILGVAAAIVFLAGCISGLFLASALHRGTGYSPLSWLAPSLPAETDDEKAVEVEITIHRGQQPSLTLDPAVKEDLKPVHRFGRKSPPL